MKEVYINDTCPETELKKHLGLLYDFKGSFMNRVLLAIRIKKKAAENDALLAIKNKFKELELEYNALVRDFNKILEDEVNDQDDEAFIKEKEYQEFGGLVVRFKEHGELFFVGSGEDWERAVDMWLELSVDQYVICLTPYDYEYMNRQNKVYNEKYLYGVDLEPYEREWVRNYLKLSKLV